MTKVISWNTSKTAEGFAFRVYAIEYQAPTETLKTGVCSSRAKATLLARKWTRYFKSQQQAAIFARAA